MYKEQFTTFFMNIAGLVEGFDRVEFDFSEPLALKCMIHIDDVIGQDTIVKMRDVPYEMAILPKEEDGGMVLAVYGPDCE